MTALVIDTCTERGLIALIEEKDLFKKKPFFYEDFSMGIAASQHLFPTLEKALKQAQGKLSKIVVTIGPGSYTGIRVGVAAALSLEYALKNVSLASVPTLFGLISSHEGKFVAAIDAKMGGIYTLFGERKKEEIIFCSEPQLLSNTQLLEYIENSCQKSEKKIFIISPHVPPLLQKLQTSLSKIEFIEQQCDPSYLLHYSKSLEKEVTQEKVIDLLYLREETYKKSI